MLPEHLGLDLAKRLGAADQGLGSPGRCNSLEEVWRDKRRHDQQAVDPLAKRPCGLAIHAEWPEADRIHAFRETPLDHPQLVSNQRGVGDCLWVQR
jgi:hypothetical protein